MRWGSGTPTAGATRCFDTLNSCNSSLSGRERLHAPSAYARPEGNTDPDTHPTSAITAVPFAVTAR